MDVGAVADVGLGRVVQEADVDAAGDAGDASAQPAREREVGGLVDRRDVDGLRSSWRRLELALMWALLPM